MTSWSEVSTPAELSIASVLMRPPFERVLDAAALRHAEIGALADDARRCPAVDAQRVIGAVADLGVALLARFHIGADAAEPQEIDRSEQHCMDQLGRGQPVLRRCRRRALISGVTGIDLALRSKTPPPFEISFGS